MTQQMQVLHMKFSRNWQHNICSQFKIQEKIIELCNMAFKE